MARESAEANELRRSLGRRLATLRRDAGATQEKLAREAGLSRSSVKNIEGGRQGAARSFWELADRLFAADGELVSGFDELAVQSSRSKAGKFAAIKAIDLVEDLFDRPADQMMSGAFTDARSAAFRWLVSRSTTPVASKGLGRVGDADVAALLVSRQRLKELDNHRGGAAAYPALASMPRSLS